MNLSIHQSINQSINTLYDQSINVLIKRSRVKMNTFTTWEGGILVHEVDRSEPARPTVYPGQRLASGSGARNPGTYPAYYVVLLPQLSNKNFTNVFYFQLHLYFLKFLSADYIQLLIILKIL